MDGSHGKSNLSTVHLPSQIMQKRCINLSMHDLCTYYFRNLCNFEALNKHVYTMRARIFLSIFLLTFLSVSVSGQPFMIKQLGIHEGLSNNHVVSIAQDKEGFLWFATEEGLNKFDGLQFISFFKEEESQREGLSGNELNHLLDDPRDSLLWIATQRAGLNCFDYKHGTFYTYRNDPSNPESLITDDITKVFPDHQGKGLWICTYWKGVDHLDKRTGRFTHYNTETVPTLPNDHIWTIADGRDGLLYIGHVSHGLSILSLKEKRVRNFRHEAGNPRSLPGNEVTCLYNDPNGNIWVGTNKGLALYCREQQEFITFDDADGHLCHRIYDIRQMDDNKLWVAMELGGIAILDLSQSLYQPSEKVKITLLHEGDNEYGLSNPSIRCLLQDSFGNIWAGSWGGGINFIRREPPLFKCYKYSPFPSINNRLSSKIASALCFDPKGRLWIGTDGGGIDVFEGDRRIATYNVQSGHLPSNNVQTSLCDSQGQLWFGLFYGGIVCYDPRTDRFQRVLSEAPHADVRSFYEDGEGTLYVSTSEGIYLIDRDSRQMKAHYDLANNLVRCALKDARGRLWVGFFGGGLGLYDQQMNEMRYLMVSDGFPSNTINALYQDSDHRLWVATGEGLVCFPQPADTTYQVYRRESGLANTHIQAIAEDRQGHIWVSTNKGISCLHEPQNHFYNYDYSDNLPIGSFSRGCVAHSTDGTFYFGSINGVCSFQPEQVLQERLSPPAMLTDIQMTSPLNEPTQAPQRLPLNGKQQEIHLPYTQNSFSIHFNIANYALMQEVEYAYMMKGLDNSWYKPYSANTVSFRNLKPGHYELLLKTRMHNQPWSNELTSLSIIISPPFYLTWWAKSLYALLICALVFILFYAYRERLVAESRYKLEKQSREQEQELNNERLRFYTNITHELRTPLTLILGPLEDIQKENTLSPKDAQKISVIHQSAIRLLNLINQILEFRKTETQNRKLCVCRADIVPLLYEIGLKYKELNRKSGVEIRFDIASGEHRLYFDKEVVQIILDNLISNAMKYTERGCITLRMSSEQQMGVNYTCIQVTDTGFGIQPEALPHIFDRYYQEGGSHQASGTGIGLSLVKNLVVLHQGDIHVESQPGVGSTFTFRLLSDNSYPNALHTDPADTKEKKETEHITTDHPASSRPILLIVEDNPDICDYIAESLADKFDVRTASQGKEGLEKAQKEIPDIIVSDIMMPVMDGGEMCRRLKQDIRTSHIPIILLTAKDSLADKEEGYQMGADSYLTKPFSASLLRSRIDNLLHSRQQLAHHFGTHAATDQKAAIMAESLNKLDNDFIQRIDHLIEERLAQDKIDIGYLSDKLCMSSSTLYRKMKALTGLSTNEYVRKVRMRRAEQLLMEGRYNISEIAYQVGFNNLFYFRQCFKEEFGKLPSEYIRKIRPATAPDTPSADGDDPATTH